MGRRPQGRDTGEADSTQLKRVGGEEWETGRRGRKEGGRGGLSGQVLHCRGKI